MGSVPRHHCVDPLLPLLISARGVERERPWLRQVCLWPLVEVEARAPSQCADTWRPKLPSEVFVSPVSHGPRTWLNCMFNSPFLMEMSPLWRMRECQGVGVVPPLREGNQHFVCSQFRCNAFYRHTGD